MYKFILHAKNLLYSFHTFLSTSVVAQTQRIDEGTWYLYNLIINSENNFYPLDKFGQPVVSEFSNLDGLNQSFNTTFCDYVGVSIIYNVNESSFITNA